MPVSIDEVLASSKERIEHAVTSHSWDEHSTTDLVHAVAAHQIVLEEVWERFQQLVSVVNAVAEHIAEGG